MSCPVCVGTCRCGRQDGAASGAAAERVSVLVDPEQYTGSEERFAATLGANGRPQWRQEVATRVRGFRRRRSRHPADDSLELDFSAASHVVDHPAADCSVPSPVDGQLDDAISSRSEDSPGSLPSENYGTGEEDSADDQEAKVIEFPRLLEEAWPVALAEPPELPPRIFEAEDVETEDVAEAEQLRDPSSGFGAADYLPTLMLDAVSTEPASYPEPVFIETAPLHLRAIAAAIDLALVLAAEWVFALILLPMGAVPAGRGALLLFSVAGLGLWALYQYLFMMYREGTPGMDATRLVLLSFDQIPPSRRQLRARTWGAVLSALSLGLGFAWAGLDEDALCWHDRISHTCLVIPDWP